MVYVPLEDKCLFIPGIEMLCGLCCWGTIVLIYISLRYYGVHVVERQLSLNTYH